MQRQSLGSPVSKLHFHGGSLPKHDDAIATDEDICKASSSSLSPYDDLRLKTAKPSSRRFSSAASSSSMPPSPAHPAKTPEKLIHLIPIVVLFCFLILYLVSHNPSQSNSLQFDVFENTDSGEMNSVIDELTAVKAKEALTIRSLRNLQETEEGGNKHKSRSEAHQRHRKFAGL